MEMKLPLVYIRKFLPKSREAQRSNAFLLGLSWQLASTGEKGALLILPLVSTLFHSEKYDFYALEDTLNKSSVFRNFQISVFSESKKMMFWKVQDRWTKPPLFLYF